MSKVPLGPKGLSIKKKAPPKKRKATAKGGIPLTDDPLLSLSPTEQAFCEAYVDIAYIRGSDTGAAFKAFQRVFRNDKRLEGWTPETNGEDGVYNAKLAAYNLLNKPVCRIYIKMLRDELKEEFKLSASRTIKELVNIAHGTMGDFIAQDSDGAISFDLKDLEPDQLALIKEAITEDILNKKGEKVGSRTKVVLYSKMDALDRLCRILGLYRDKIDLNLTRGDFEKLLEYYETYLGIRQSDGQIAGAAFPAIEDQGGLRAEGQAEPVEVDGLPE